MSDELVTLERRVGALVEECGYVTQYETTIGARSYVRDGVAAIVKPSQLIGFVGNSRSRVSTKIRFVLLRSAYSTPLDERSMLWESVRRDALGVLSKVAQFDDVVEVGDMSFERLESRITSYDEVAIEVVAVVVMNYQIGDDGE